MSLLTQRFHGATLLGRDQVLVSSTLTNLLGKGFFLVSFSLPWLFLLGRFFNHRVVLDSTANQVRDLTTHDQHQARKCPVPD